MTENQLAIGKTYILQDSLNRQCMLDYHAVPWLSLDRLFSALAIPCLLLFLMCLLWHYLHDPPYKSSSNQLPLPPGSMGLPFIGETISFIKDCATMKFFRIREQKYGPIFKTHILGSPTVRIAGPDCVKKVLLGEHSLVTAIWPPSFATVMGKNALSQLDAHTHKIRRKEILKAFRWETLSDFAQPMQKIIKEGLKGWCGEKEVKVYDESRMLTFKSACCILLGFDCGDAEINDFAADFQDFVKGLFTVPIDVPGFSFNKALKAKQRIHQKIKQKLSEDNNNEVTTEVDENDNYKFSANPEKASFQSIFSILLDMYKSENRDIDLQMITELAVELLLGGQETSTSTATCTVLLLGNHPEVTLKVIEELESWGLMDPHVDLTYDVIQRLTYVNYVMKEVMRMYPPIGGGYRKALQDIEVGGYRIPKGWNINYDIKDTHDLSKYFPDADNFNPDRWEELKNNKNPICHYMPFGLGARACVGKEYAKLFMKIFIIQTVRTYTWELIDKDPEMLKIPVVNPVGGLRTKFYKRCS